MKCPQKNAHGVCGVIKGMCGIGVKPMPPFCRACAGSSSTPDTGEPNNVTATLAYGALKQQNRAEAARFAKEWESLLGKVEVKHEIPRGPGTELAKMLHKLGIPECTTCHKHAKEMNKRGHTWCSENEELILQWLEEGAKRNKVVFIKTAARWFLRKAIRRARKKEEAQARAERKKRG